MWSVPWVVKWWTNSLIQRSLKKTKTETTLVYRSVKGFSIYFNIILRNHKNAGEGGGVLARIYTDGLWSFPAYIIPKFLMLEFSYGNPLLICFGFCMIFFSILFKLDQKASVKHRYQLTETDDWPLHPFHHFRCHWSYSATDCLNWWRIKKSSRKTENVSWFIENGKHHILADY